jgi:Tol biopolymer transport system component
MGGLGARWSPDGRRIAFESAPEGNADIYVIDTEGGAPKRITTDPANDNWPGWSADGRWIYFTSNRTGKAEIWRAPAEGGAERQITHQGGWVPQESPDGEMLYYAKTRGGVGGIWKVSPEGGAESQVLESRVGLNLWQPLNDGIYFVQRRRMQFFDFASKNITTLGHLEIGSWVGLSVAPDRRQAIFSQVDQDSHDIMLVENLR